MDQYLALIIAALLAIIMYMVISMHKTEKSKMSSAKEEPEDLRHRPESGYFIAPFTSYDSPCCGSIGIPPSSGGICPNF